MKKLTQFRTMGAVTAVALLASGFGYGAERSAALRRPNLVIMLADDMGFGELQCLNPSRGKIKTPRLDAIAASGMVFLDAHSGSSVCTPTRYGLMTGRYAWRTRLQSGVLTGGESLIAEGRLTLAKLLAQEGYHCTIVGKWHLGMLFDGEHVKGDVPVGSIVTHGPLDRGGFHEFHGFHHSRQIKAWVDNDRVTEIIEPVDVLPKLTRMAVEYINTRAETGQPFFLYVPWSSPHSPVVPSRRWQGRSGLNAHADFVMQTDDCFGQVIDALQRNGLRENTLVICASDNGTSAPTSKMSELQAMGHFPSGPLRGSKADIWDGGHRVPFIASWPSIIEEGSTTNGLVCLTDVLATVAELLSVDLPSSAGEDSVSFSPLLLQEGEHQRKNIVHHSAPGYFAVRVKNWKLALCPRSGGWTGIRPSAKSWQEAREQGLPMMQLYDMTNDISEQTNLAPLDPAKVEELIALLDALIDRGRSTPGAQQENDVPVFSLRQPPNSKSP